MTAGKPTTTADYLAAANDAERAEFARIQAAVERLVPGVEHGFSYDMPNFKLNGRPFLWVGIFKAHMSLFPGTIKFTPDVPLPDDELERIIIERAAKIQAAS